MSGRAGGGRKRRRAGWRMFREDEGKGRLESARICIYFSGYMTMKLEKDAGMARTDGDMGIDI